MFLVRKILSAFLMLCLAPPAFAAGPDQIKLKNGKVIQGAVLFWNGGQLNFDSDEEGHLVISSSDLEEIRLAPRPASAKASVAPLLPQ